MTMHRSPSPTLTRTNEDTPLVVPANGVLTNDTDPDVGDTLTAVLGTTVAHGSLTLNANGSFTYTPAADYNGTDSFTYHAQRFRQPRQLDGNTVTVTITITPVNDPPKFDPRTRRRRPPRTTRRTFTESSRATSTATRW